jgi:two-component system, cell cycle response regulator
MKKPCLLVVDDNAINLALVSYLLESSGCEVCAAENGEQALTQLDQGKHFDAVLCDIQMPVMDGYELARRIKSRPELASIPLVAVTALAMVGDRDRILGAGFDTYVSKPIDPASFIATLATLVPALQSGHAVAASAPSPAPLPSPRGETILVLDDTPYNVEIKRNLLEPLGYRVLSADTPAAALALARAQRPDLIISDVGMREGSGFDFIASVKADPTLRDIPFLFLSATHWDESARERGMALGAERYLRRPIDSESLLAEIRQALASRKPADS